MRKTLLAVIIAVLFATMFAPIAASTKNLSFHKTPMKFNDTTAYVENEEPSAAPLAGGEWAVIIGIADYQGSDSDLWHPDEDAKDMYSELTRQQGYRKANIKLLTNNKATAQAISNAITWLVTNEKAGDEVVFFYSGHGYRAPDGDGWDSDVESDGNDEMIVTYDFYGLPDGWFKTKLAAVESTKFALMFGSCYSAACSMTTMTCRARAELLHQPVRLRNLAGITST